MTVCCCCCCLWRKNTKSLLHFCKFLVNANIDLITKDISRTAFNKDSVDILREYCQIFTHVEYIFLLPIHLKRPFKLIPFPLWDVDSSSTPMPGPTPLTTSNGSLIVSHTFAQLCNKVPIGYSGSSSHHSKNRPFPWDNHHPHLLTLFLDPADPPHQGYLDPISCFL